MSGEIKNMGSAPDQVGRKSGLNRQAVLEVVRHDKEIDRYIVVAAFGEKTQWVRNIVRRPHVSIRVGRRKLDVVAERLSPDEAGEEAVSFRERHPHEARLLRLIGYKAEDSEADFRDLGKLMLFVALRVKGSATRPG